MELAPNSPAGLAMPVFGTPSAASIPAQGHGKNDSLTFIKNVVLTLLKNVALVGR